MFFSLSKIIGFFTVPSNAVATVCALGVLLLATRFRKAGSRVLICGVVLLLVAGFSPLGHLLLLPLSERFPAWSAAGRPPDGIIVLGGAIDPETSQARGSLEMDASAERIVTMLQLARRYPAAPIVFSGGSANLIETPVPEAPIAGDLLEDFGTARSRIVLESESRTTAENAAFTRKLISPKPGERWLLVTSAFHMPRSIGAFRKAGFDVEAYPVDWRTRGWSDARTPFATLSAGLARTDVAVHEWVGLIAYWATGRSSELFPGPRKTN
ncbi:MAG: YdcF family protein [Afipia sp.]|nr:YdcF family protein [Afipia sp.]